MKSAVVELVVDIFTFAIFVFNILIKRFFFLLGNGGGDLYIIFLSKYTNQFQPKKG